MNTTTETVQHTPTPWELGKYGSISGGVTRRYTNGVGKDQLVMVCVVQPDNGGTQQGNTEFIVRACNNHEALVAALERIAAYDAPDAHAMIQQARAALTAAQS